MSYLMIFIVLLIIYRINKNLPRHGSFLTRNSSSATHPPPTRTMTVERKIRTSRNF